MPKAGITYGPRIKAPDYKEIAKNAENAVLAEFEQIGVTKPVDIFTKKRKVRADDVAAKAAEIIRQADAEIGMYADARDQALAHLWFYEQRIGLGRSLGLTQTGYRGILAKALYGDKKHPLPAEESNEALIEAAKKEGLKVVDDAETKLVQTHQVVAAARARRQTAVPFMQEAVLALSLPPYNWTPDHIAEHTEIERSVIYKQRTAAAKRHNL
ncbi:hypothetical protein [Streptomyces sp. NPDC046976]|uniref:hypothetical protein n=1 Tax=Streptomyces sp. NPDC046976 TaxID=3155258 RepID=UPI0033C404DA